MFENFKNPITGDAGAFDNIGDYVAVVLNTALGIGAALSLIGVIVSGIKFVTSRGDVKSSISAKSALTFSIVALVLTLGAYTILNLITGTVTEGTTFNIGP